MAGITLKDTSINEKLSYFRRGPLLKLIGKTDFSRKKKYNMYLRSNISPVWSVSLINVDILLL